MRELNIIKRFISNFIGKYEVYLKPIGKLTLSLFVFITINASMGYMSKVNNIALVLIASLMCSFMPMNFIVLLAAVFVLLHMYALSLECAAVVLVLFLVLFLLYFRLSPKDTITVVLTPILTGMGIPYVMPVAMGLIGGPMSAASVACGVIVGCVLKNINTNAEAIQAMETADMASKLKLIIDSVMADKGMILMIIAFAITVLVVYVISQLPIDYSWSIAVVAGAIVDAVVVFIGNIAMHASLSGFGVFMGTILAVVVGLVIQFLIFDLDYKRTEKVQFQDDDYYYYVKAVPKRGAPTKSRKGTAVPRKRPVQMPASNNVEE